MRLRLGLYSLILAALSSRAQLVPFGDFYGEGVYLNGVHTVAGLANLRAGVLPATGWETYLVARVGADARTFLENSDAVYDDNYLFTGAGVDYLGPLPGLRLTAQIGYSKDLNSKIHLQGFDYRAGLISYHEVRWPWPNFINEFYSESLYIYRYRNLLVSPQWRAFYEVWNGSSGRTAFGAGPLLTTVLGIDSQGLDYNRFVEARLGARFRMFGMGGLALAPQYVWGSRWMTGQGYSEWRVLLTSYVAF